MGREKGAECGDGRGVVDAGGQVRVGEGADGGEGGGVVGTVEEVGFENGVQHALGDEVEAVGSGSPVVAELRACGSEFEEEGEEGTQRGRGGWVGDPLAVGGGDGEVVGESASVGEQGGVGKGEVVCGREGVGLWSVLGPVVGEGVVLVVEGGEGGGGGPGAGVVEAVGAQQAELEEPGAEGGFGGEAAAVVFVGEKDTPVWAGVVSVCGVVTLGGGRWMR